MLTWIVAVPVVTLVAIDKTAQVTNVNSSPPLRPPKKLIR